MMVSTSSGPNLLPAGGTVLAALAKSLGGWIVPWMTIPPMSCLLKPGDRISLVASMVACDPPRV